MTTPLNAANALYIGPKDMFPNYVPVSDNDRCMQSRNEKDTCLVYSNRFKEPFGFPSQEFLDTYDSTTTLLVKKTNVNPKLTISQNSIENFEFPLTFLLLSSLGLNAYFIFNHILKKAFTHS